MTAKEKTNNKPPQQAELQILIVNGSTLKDIRGMCSENTKVLYFPKDMVPDMTERIMGIVVENPTVQKTILHTCRQMTQIMKQQKCPNGSLLIC